MSRRREIADGIRTALREVADPVIAPGQQAYMKSAMPFLGVRLPAVRRIVTTAVPRTIPVDDVLAAAEALWDAAGHREERYAALALLARPQVRGDARLLWLVERFVVEGRWWDITDELAHRLADALDDEDADGGTAVRGLVLAWSVDRRDEPVPGAGLWLRRIAIIAQLGRRERVDRALLAAVIEPNLADGDFFIRKAIGWALREVARRDPAWVVAFADARPLSPLSRREALKHVR